MLGQNRSVWPLGIKEPVTEVSPGNTKKLLQRQVGLCGVVTHLLKPEVLEKSLRTTLKAGEKIQEPVGGSTTVIPFSQKFLQLDLLLDP